MLKKQQLTTPQYLSILIFTCLCVRATEGLIPYYNSPPYILSVILVSLAEDVHRRFQCLMSQLELHELGINAYKIENTNKRKINTTQI